jgi:TPR repeat protein
VPSLGLRAGEVMLNSADDLRAAIALLEAKLSAAEARLEANTAALTSPPDASDPSGLAARRRLAYTHRVISTQRRELQTLRQWLEQAARPRPSGGT